MTTEVGKRGGLDCPGLRPHIAITFEEYLADQQAWLRDYGSFATTDYLKKDSEPGSHISLPIQTGGVAQQVEHHQPKAVQAAA